MLNKIKGRLRHIFRRYIFTSIAAVALFAFAKMLKTSIIYDKEIVFIYGLAFLNLLFFIILCLSIYHDVRHYKQQITDVRSYGNEVNKLRRLQSKGGEGVKSVKNKVSERHNKVD
ncbi:hypothetical protein [Shewanella baltica]|uniref:hypothetical protein n=1 Tax=Shewanella baltica TaxID=62322 RepID=UPI00217E6D09|nr:hypothetical protein [Shewanella baltica]MCS6175327.1 hypothetical protein [Shewanella baltica]